MLPDASNFERIRDLRATPSPGIAPLDAKSGRSGRLAGER
jgi:hypothetical protein